MTGREHIPAAVPRLGDQARMAPIAALMYVTAAAVVAVSLLLPHPDSMNRPALFAAALVGLVMPP